jgi:hypothetical protein
MKRIRHILAAATLIATASPGYSIDLGLGLFKKKPADPATAPAKAADDKVKQLVTTLQSDMNVERRKAAAESIRSIDPRNSPDVIPALVGSLLKDPSPSVRSSAAETIGSMKSVYTTAAEALAHAEKNDPDSGVRAAAKAALWQYHLNGAKVANTVTTPLNQTPEPPLSKKPITPAVTNPMPSPIAQVPKESTEFRPISQGIGKVQMFQPTPEPPLAKPKAPPASVPDTKVSPMIPSTVPTVPLLIPQEPSGAPTITPPPVLK